MDKMKKVVTLFAVVLAGACLFAQTYYVNVKSTSLKDKPSARGKTLVSVSYGDAVTVVDSGSEKDWVLVRSGKTEGWVSNASLSKRKIVASSGSGASAKEVSLAGKGFGDGMESKSNGKGNYTSVNALEKNNVTDKELDGFVADGGLQSAK